jgi:ion channel
MMKNNKKDMAVDECCRLRGCFFKIHERRKVLLLAVLVFLLVCYPYLNTDHDEESLFVAVTTSVILLVSCYAISQKKWHVIVAVLLAIPGVIGRGLLFSFENEHLNLEIQISSVVFYIFAVVLVLGQVLQSKRVTLNTIAGAVCGYLLIGLAFASLYMVLVIVDPNAFTLVDTKEVVSGLIWPDLVFFSFVTLTTLGYGDITPITTRAQSLTIIEAVVGVFYMGVLVAWLVSAFRTENLRKELKGLSE